MEQFDVFAMMAVDEGLVLTSDKGLHSLYDILKHFSAGGTIDNFQSSEIAKEEVPAILASAWNSAREFASIVDEAGEEGMC